jgi:UDP-N-acetyl-D-mannosaminuronic acid dehydrogenase
MRSLPQVVGGLDEQSTARAEALFRLITPKIVRVSSLEAAEMIKLINNTYRDLTFAFANEVALIAEHMGLSAGEMIHAANVDYPRSNVARPGFVGGPCLEKDALILIDSLRKIDFKPKVIEEARKINHALPDHVAQRIIKEIRSLRRAPAVAKVLITGFAFKGRPATEDVRGSAAVPIMRRLQASRMEVWGHDFVTPEKVIADLGARACTLEDGFEGADAVIIMNNHPGYQSAGIPELARRLRAPALLFDSWGLLTPGDFQDVPGLRYGTLGAPFHHA